ncbi:MULTISPECIES: MarR family winged helix-turn-helix transcriptional regulator [Bradyrhizobium]|uniref:DNA-binding transcriptional regulator, MarR family n=1 Tax=Bradyrhizobium brasilense TaxID=1419277 RepID=A0A1G6KVV1_9BRAD|nr:MULTISPECIES: helix-turn-helix domain-containing protein [Bradyrhizobium]MCA6098043.1 winged helix-turn-helix transcriptional regulator [Bradyrhizobium australafricanum]MCC8970248.1 winged helix-turn-helix transcriptional regulator [Bradyrhizobium brasilense]MCP1841032.1 DNA-binding MarR family transcriptional regulator [Bradyrhizobium sp. USDA 4538]MCP1901595.1 DNA-binding MarR family transcriptional regulator [Bradyrhizobium sp. USDA 4537]MCP1992749.1 DNA-binding MarR family transcription
MAALKGPSKSPRQDQKRVPSQGDYETLSQFRYLIRRFLEFSQDAAKAAGLTPRQHQALLAIRGYPGGGPVAVGDLAERLRLRHHTTVELVDRLSEAGLVERVLDPADQRRVLLKLTGLAADHLAELSAVHLDELSRIEPLLKQVLSRRSE